MQVTLDPFDRGYLEKSWHWLNDPETKRLTFTPDFTKDDQERFFSSFPREDYLIWGVAHEGEPIGCAAIKGISAGKGTYSGYIGVAHLRGRGLGRSMLQAVLSEARSRRLGELDLLVLRDNLPAVRLYRSAGFAERENVHGKVRMRLLL